MTLLTPMEACDRLRVGRWKLNDLITVRRKIKAKRMGYRTLRIYADSVEEYLAQKQAKAVKVSAWETSTH